MSSLLKGLAQIKANQEAQKEKEKARQEAQNRVKADWFKWPKDVDTATVTFLKEFDEAAAGYTPEQNGTAIIAVEHQAPGPDGFKRRGMCTAETEGQCYPDERHRMNPAEGWKPRQNLYIDALVDFGDGDRKHVVIQRNGNSSFANELIDEAVEENSITNNAFRIKRNGSGTQTTWSLKRLKDEPFDSSEVTPYDLEEVAVRKVTYENQAAYYGAVYKDTDATEPDTQASGPADEEW